MIFMWPLDWRQNMDGSSDNNEHIVFMSALPKVIYFQETGSLNTTEAHKEQKRKIIITREDKCSWDMCQFMENL